MDTTPAVNNPDQFMAARFAAAVVQRDYVTAVDVLVTVTNAGDRDLAALLLQGALQAGVEAMRTGSTHVTQVVHTVAPGARLTGLRIDSL